MSGRRFLRAVPAGLVVTTALALTVLSGDSRPSRPPLGFTVEGGPFAGPVEPVALRRRTITPEFDPPLKVRANRVVFARGFVACDPGEIYRVNVTVEQGTTTGHGVTVGRCTGDVQLWTAVVVARRGGIYESGPSTACAVATTRRLGVTDTFEWCGTPVLAAD